MPRPSSAPDRSSLGVRFSLWAALPRRSVLWRGCGHRVGLGRARECWVQQEVLVLLTSAEMLSSRCHCAVTPLCREKFS